MPMKLQWKSLGAVSYASPTLTFVCAFEGRLTVLSRSVEIERSDAPIAFKCRAAAQETRASVHSILE